ncbi:hypothetical protein CANCADRAFT_56543 [Tortispora caseinolytica NRRL Y-17796]|uniref:Uncharacterized protein n=1 Tax=Tortispora caseinolytica NRRL Y-17796 TaxID=767744 RepID=A0A1E4TDQ9_9ASCO|nr:hypothetical protein CANCADRAFT_56543 [Tortispora caseinolytica NRRL Y-17796]
MAKRLIGYDSGIPTTSCSGQSLRLDLSLNEKTIPYDSRLKIIKTQFADCLA